MRTNWTRERVIRHILAREAEGLSFAVGNGGTDHLLYLASRRTFGSWRNALLAAGIPPERVLTWERWSPARILSQIRLLSRRRRPLSTTQMEQRYHNLVSAARRHFGSWPKAVLTAGVDPVTLQKVVSWNQERVIEAILTRALRGESLVARMIEPRSLVTAGHRMFGSWREAVMTAGLDPKVTEMPPRRNKRLKEASALVGASDGYGAACRVWSRERVVECILSRIQERKPVNAYAVFNDNPRLYGAAIRHLKRWDEALRASGLNPAEHRRCRPYSRRPTAAPHKSQTEQAVRLEGSE